MNASALKCFAAVAACLPAACAGTGAPSSQVSAATMPQNGGRGANAAWGTYQHGPDRNAVFNRPDFSASWKYDTGAKINGGMALAGDTLLLDTFRGDVLALDARSGRQIWSTRLPNVAMSTPIVAGGAVFVGTGRNGLLTREAGKEVWGVPAGDRVVALDLRTGAQRWSFHTTGEDMPSPVFFRNEIVFANGDWHAYALAAGTGKQLWVTDVGGISTMASALAADGSIIVTSCPYGIRKSEAIALDPRSGAIRWRSPYGHCDGSPAYGDGKIFVASVAPAKEKYVGSTVVAALDPKNGKPAWTYRSATPGVWSIVASDESSIAGAYHDGIYYQPAPLDDAIFAFDASSGKLRWRFHTTGPVKMSPVIKDGRLYVGDTAGLLYTLDAKTGHLIEARPFKRPFGTSPPIVAGDTLFIVNGTSVLALPLTGEVAK